MKLCNEEGCKQFVFSHGFCKNHQHRRTDDKWMNHLASIKEGSRDYYQIPRISESRQKEIVQQSAADRAFYAHIWETREHRCLICDKYLGSEPSTMYFHHILEKAKFKKLRYEEDNIILLCADHHSEAHQSKGKPDWYKALTIDTTLLFTKRALL